MSLDRRHRLLIFVRVTKLKNLNNDVTLVGQSMKDGLTTWEDVVNELLELVFIYLIDRNQAFLKFFYEVPM